ncbi:hypothetical protein Dimus_016057 [Dionaea muscipula]
MCSGILPREQSFGPGNHKIMGTLALLFICPMSIGRPTTLLIRITAAEFPLHAKVACSVQGQCSARRLLRSQARCSAQYADGDQDTVQDLRIPRHWLVPSRALQESEWLRVALHKWLDDEYCPEATNIEISKVAADSYYRSLLQKTTDLGEILLQMVKELESISYRESFHGAFSAANAAVSLIAQKMELE